MKNFNIVLVLFILIVIFSCRKSDRDNDVSTNTSTYYALSQSMVYDVFKIVHQAALSTKGITTNNLADSSTVFGCDTLIVDTLLSKKIDIQFNGSCYNHSGKILSKYSSKYDVIGCVVDISFNNYKHKSYNISGDISYTYNGVVNNTPTYTINANKFTITSNTNKFSEFSGTQTLKVVAGETTAIFSDDLYEIDGSASGRTFAGNAYLATINTPLTLSGSCDFIETGEVLVNPENKYTRILDFGFGCNNKAVTRIYGIDYDITIP